MSAEENEWHVDPERTPEPCFVGIEEALNSASESVLREVAGNLRRVLDWAVRFTG